jgi:methyl-accepting chemotaxis protein
MYRLKAPRLKYPTRFLDALERILPPIQEPLLALDSRMVFCVALDRQRISRRSHKIYSQPPRAEDRAWNKANSRQRQIIDDRAGLPQRLGNASDQGKSYPKAA